MSMIKGKWVNQQPCAGGVGGKFVRKDSSFRNFIGSDRFPAETGRYHLYIAHACPWAHRTVIFRQLKGLGTIIGLTAVNAHIGEFGWTLDDPINGLHAMHEIYTLADAHYTGRVTVPVLWDKKEKTIVNNESSDVIRMFNTEFDALTGNTDDYYPKALQKSIDDINKFIYTDINDGVYKAGFATEQCVYDKEVKKLFDALDVIEGRLRQHRYLVGDTITEADWRLFVTLIRFDIVYVNHFNCNIRHIIDYPNLPNYMRELYQVEGIKETVHIASIKEHYYTSHAAINPMGIIPQGPEIDYEASHDRYRFD